MSHDKELDALYAELPTIDCQGACWDSCGPIQMSSDEHERIERAGIDIPPGGSFLRDGPYTCPALAWTRQCLVYEIRPLICRIWGLSKSLPCTYGCKPSRRLSDAEAYEFIARAYEISGQQKDAAMVRLALDPANQASLSWAKREVARRTELKLRQIRRPR